MKKPFLLGSIFGVLWAAASWAAPSSVTDVGVAPFDRTHPALGFELTASAVPGFGNAASTRGFQLQVEYQPQFVQPYGVLSLGGSGGFYPSIPAGSGPHWSVGGQGRYQAHFFRGQPIVPFAGYAVEHRLKPFGAGGETVHGPMFGAMLLLNFLDRNAAAGIYANLGVSRSYLVAEWRRAGSDAFYLGLRLER